MNIKLASCLYGAQKGFRLFINDHIFLDTPGTASTTAEYIISPYLTNGTNTVSAQGGSMSYSLELEGTDIPDLDVSVKDIQYFGDPGKVTDQFYLIHEEDDSIVEEIDTIKQAKFTFHNNTHIDFTRRFESFTQCNKNDEMFYTYLKTMKTFSKKMYHSLYSGKIDIITENSYIRIEDDCACGFGSANDITGMYKKALENIAALPPLIKDVSEDHFVFSPSCGGRMWLIGIMPTSQQASQLQDAIAMKPAARPKITSDLFCTEWIDQNAKFLPCYLAFIDNECQIVR